MDMTQVDRLLRQMPLGRNRGQLMVELVYETMLCRSLEACTGTLEALIMAAEHAGERSAKTARAITTATGATIRVFAPEERGPTFRTLAIMTPAGNYVAALDYISAATAYAKICGAAVTRYWSGLPRALQAEALPTDLDSCARWAAQRQRYADDAARLSLDRAVWAAANGTNTLFEAGVSRDFRHLDLAPDDGDEWGEGNHAVHDTVSWQAVFPALKAAIVSYGLEDRFRADAREFAERRFGAPYPTRAAAVELGDRLARADGYLPGAIALKATRLMHRRVIEANLGDLIGKFTECHERCRDFGHASADSQFTHRRRRDEVFVFAPPSGRPDVDLLVLGSRDASHVVALLKDAAGAVTGLEVHRFGLPLETWFQDATGKPITEDLLEDLGSTDGYTNPHAKPLLHDCATAVAAACQAAAVSDDVPPTLAGRFTVTPDGVVATRGPETNRNGLRGWDTLGPCLEDSLYAMQRLQMRGPRW